MIYPFFPLAKRLSKQQILFRPEAFRTKAEMLINTFLCRDFLQSVRGVRGTGRNNRDAGENGAGKRGRKRRTASKAKRKAWTKAKRCICSEKLDGTCRKMFSFLRFARTLGILHCVGIKLRVKLYFLVKLTNRISSGIEWSQVLYRTWSCPDHFANINFNKNFQCFRERYSFNKLCWVL